MAEIHVGPKRRSFVWLWSLLLVIIVGALVYYVFYYQNG
jgi:hypothetical protein